MLRKNTFQIQVANPEKCIFEFDIFFQKNNNRFKSVM